MFKIDQFIFFCLMKSSLKLATLKKRLELEMEVAVKLGSLYDKVTLLLPQQQSLN
jgi:hypothetical protein